MDEQMGGQDEPAGYNVTYKYTKFSNAYMLVYIRESDWNTIMCEVLLPALLLLWPVSMPVYTTIDILS